MLLLPPRTVTKRSCGSAFSASTVGVPRFSRSAQPRLLPVVVGVAPSEYRRMRHEDDGVPASAGGQRTWAPSEARRVSACGVLLAICRCGADCSRSLLAARGAPALLRLLEAEGERVGGRLPDAAADTRETPVVRDCADNSDDDDGAGAPAGVRGAVRFGACVPVCAPVVCCCVCARACVQLL